MEAGEEGSGLRGWSQEAELGPRGGVIKLLQGSGCRELGAELVEGVGGGGDVAVKPVLRQFTPDSSVRWVYRP